MPEPSTSLILIRAEATDLWREADGGWSANCCWVKRRLIYLPAAASDTAIARAVMRSFGYRGMRRDGWSGCEHSWRSGCVGVWAETETYEASSPDEAKRLLSGS